MKKKIYFNGSTIYQLFIFLLLTSPRDYKRYFILNDTFPDEIKKNIKNKIIVKVKSRKKNKIMNIFEKIFKLLIIKFRTTFGDLAEVKNYNVYGETLYSPLLKSKKNSIYILEDGIGNYIKYEDINKNYTYYIKRFFISIIFMKKLFNYSGRSKEVEKIFLSSISQIPYDILEKVEVIDLKELWNKKTVQEKEAILTIFSHKKDEINKLEKKDIILFTQPISEDGYISEKEKIKIYSKILDKYPNEKTIIKKHPREKTKYSEIFPNILVLETLCPSELLFVLGLKIKRSVTIFSTAALYDKNIQIDFYGTEVHPKLLEKFGSLDNLFKRNAFLEENNE